MQTCFRYFVERHLLAYLITVFIVVLGVGSFISIKRDSFPAVEFGKILLTTRYPGASPEDVEVKVTHKIEQELRQVTGIKRFMSWSVEYVPTIYLVLDPNVDDQTVVVRLVSQLGAEELDSFVTRIGTFGDIGASEQESNATATNPWTFIPCNLTVFLIFSMVYSRHFSNV